MRPMFTPAQSILLSLGVDPWVLLFANWKRRNPQFRKAGPGRRHQQGKHRPE